MYDVVEKMIMIQCDYGNCFVCKNVWFKYMVDCFGLEIVKEELENCFGWSLEEVKLYYFDYNGDCYGWVEGIEDKWYFILFVEGGCIMDYDDYKLMIGLWEIVKVYIGEFCLIFNQNLIIVNVLSDKKDEISVLIE